MKKILFLFLVLTSISHAQIGIGTNSPNPSAILDLSSSKKGLLLPRVTKATDISAPTNGMLIYDLEYKCIRFYENGAWSGCFSPSVPVVTTDCASSAFAGTYFNGLAMTASNTFSVTITNTSFVTATIALQPSDLVLSGPVGGVTVASVSTPSITLTAGASEVVTYTLSGTPTATGALTGTWTKQGLTCVKTITVANRPILALNCAGTNNGTLQQGIPASGVSSVLSYTNGDGTAHTGQVVASTGVTGLTATLAGGTFASGSGTLTYTITGTPNTVGTASFAINIGGQSCTLSRTVAAPITMPTGITLATDRLFFVLSVYDQDYLPYTTPTAAATTNVLAANGDNEPITVNIQGAITTAGVSVQIPATATASGTLPAFSNTITIPANMTQDGVSRNLTLSWASQAYTSATKFITATIAAVGGTLNPKKLDLNAGSGPDGLGMQLGQFTYPYNNSMATTTYTVRVFPGIPDKMFGKPDNNGNAYSHLMLYVPVQVEDDRVWLTNKLGAHYTNLNQASFDPTKQATATTDHLAYGSLFQWGRRPDGHELITYTNSTTAIPVQLTIATQADAPTHPDFIIDTTEPADWRLNPIDNLWLSEASPNNPCPVGFKVPSAIELNTLVTATGITNSTTAFNSRLKLSLTAVREYNDGTISRVGTGTSQIWSSSTTGAPPYYLDISTTIGLLAVLPRRAYGFSVNCVKDNEAVVTYDCTGPLVGNLIAGLPVVSGVTKTITATVTKPGIYNISSTVNGVTFAANGTFTATGTQTVVLTATGTPTIVGTFTHSVGSCSFQAVAIADILTYALSNTPTADSKTFTFATTAPGTVIFHAVQNLWTGNSNVEIAAKVALNGTDIAQNALLNWSAPESVWQNLTSVGQATVGTGLQTATVTKTSGTGMGRNYFSAIFIPTSKTHGLTSGVFNPFLALGNGCQNLPNNLPTADSQRFTLTSPSAGKLILLPSLNMATTDSNLNFSYDIKVNNTVVENVRQPYGNIYNRYVKIPGLAVATVGAGSINVDLVPVVGSYQAGAVNAHTMQWIHVPSTSDITTGISSSQIMNNLPSTNSHRFTLTAPAAGRYIIMGQAGIWHNSNVGIKFQVQLNGTDLSSPELLTSHMTGQWQTLSFSNQFRVNASGPVTIDYVPTPGFYSDFKNVKLLWIFIPD